MRKVKLGIIGCGLAARELHLPALEKLSDRFEITALCNHTEKKAMGLSKLLGGVPYVLDYKELLSRQDVEAVDIALPINLNCRVTEDALKAGKHVLVEKPIAANAAEARKMLHFPQKYKLVMMVAENFRYRLVYSRVKELIKNGTIGKPYAAMWNVYYLVTEEGKYAKIKWRRHHSYEGGFMTDAGVHNVAALRYLFGEISEAKAFTKSINPKIGHPDTMSIQFLTSKGINGVFNLFFSVNGYWENKLLIFGKKGSIVVEENKITIKENDKKDIQEIAEDDSGYCEEFIDFYNAITKNRKVRSTFEKAVKDLNVILKALKVNFLN
jgi:predicted dehydrogenase